MNLKYAVYLLGLFFCIVSIYYMIHYFRKKQWINGLWSLSILPWVAFFIACVALGGSAFNDAEHVFAGYQAGHYYLMDHGVFTEVSADVFHRMRVLEIVGWVSLGVNIIYAMIRNARTHKKDSILKTR